MDDVFRICHPSYADVTTICCSTQTVKNARFVVLYFCDVRSGALPVLLVMYAVPVVFPSTAVLGHAKFGVAVF
jgi:hypothetical protein